jgi:hypothetical protein
LFCQKEKTLDIDFKRAKELIDEKAIADALHFIKEKVFRKVRAVLVLYQMGWTVYQCE